MKDFKLQKIETRQTRQHLGAVEYSLFTVIHVYLLYGCPIKLCRPFRVREEDLVGPISHAPCFLHLPQPED